MKQSDSIATSGTNIVIQYIADTIWILCFSTNSNVIAISVFTWFDDKIAMKNVRALVWRCEMANREWVGVVTFAINFSKPAKNSHIHGRDAYVRQKQVAFTRI